MIIGPEGRSVAGSLGHMVSVLPLAKAGEYVLEVSIRFVIIKILTGDHVTGSSPTSTTMSLRSQPASIAPSL